MKSNYIYFLCNQCGNDRQIESELSQECKASGHQGHIEEKKICPGDDKQEHGHGIFILHARISLISACNHIFASN